MINFFFFYFKTFPFSIWLTNQCPESLLTPDVVQLLPSLPPPLPSSPPPPPPAPRAPSPPHTTPIPPPLPPPCCSLQWFITTSHKVSVSSSPSAGDSNWGPLGEPSRARACQCSEIRPSQLGCVWLSALSGCSRPYVPERMVMITALVMIVTMLERRWRRISLMKGRLPGWGWQGRWTGAALWLSDHRRSSASVCVCACACVNLFPGCDWRRRPQCSQWLAN